jgi:hemolysin III
MASKRFASVDTMIPTGAPIATGSVSGTTKSLQQSTQNLLYRTGRTDTHTDDRPTWTEVVIVDVVLEMRPTWRGRLHAWAFVTAIPLGIILLLTAERTSARVASAIYASSLVALFGTSAAYHRLANCARSRRIMQRLDHSMIFLLIAGTYTPMCLLVLPPAWGIPILCIVGTVALTGVALKLFAFDHVRGLGSVLYIVLSWAVIAALPVLVHRLSLSEMVLLFGGGIFYTGGAIIFTTRRPNPRPNVFGYHEVWHACTIVAGICHFATISLVVRGA